MNTIIRKSTKIKDNHHLVFLSDKVMTGLDEFLSAKEIAFVKARHKENENRHFSINQLNRTVFIEIVKEGNEPYITLENYRNAACKLTGKLNHHKIASIFVVDGIKNGNHTLAFAEGILLSNYQFLKYFTDKKKKKNALQEINVVSAHIDTGEIEQLQILAEGVCHTRDLVNEPVSFLDSVQYSKELSRLGKEAGFNVEVLNKKKIESLKMGGILAVNKGSVIPPTFNILEWNPKNAKNKKPIVLVGKGIVYDTGGLSLKPTPNSMDLMKSDMAGSAAVAGAIYAIAKAGLPVHVIGLIPATDNRPGGNAYAPGDVITMFDGTTVEVLNTDAEGRLVLADALSYAKKYQPEFVVDLATLTGAAVRAIGTRAIVSMGNTDEQHKKMEETGYDVFERLAIMPFWDDYSEQIKSKIADINNLGGDTAGHITAGKFLEHFTKDKKGKSMYPWIHLDIAGPAFLKSNDTYRPEGGTGVGVRLLFEFVKRRTT